MLRMIIPVRRPGTSACAADRSPNPGTSGTGVRIIATGDNSSEGPGRTRRSGASNPRKGRARQALRRRVNVEGLEGRTLLATSVSLSNVLDAFNSGRKGVDVARISDQAFGLDLPVLKESLSDALPSLKGSIAQPFQLAASLTSTSQLKLTPDGSTATSPQVPNNISVDYFSSTPQVGSNDLLRVTWVVGRTPLPSTSTGATPTGNPLSLLPVSITPGTQLVRVLPPGTPASQPVRVSLGGATGFDYLDKTVTGQLKGSAQGSAENVYYKVTFGVDLVGGKPTFFVADTTRLVLENVHAEGAVSGQGLRLRSLNSVNAAGTVVLDASAELKLKDTDADHKLRIGDWSKPAVVSGDINASARLQDVAFTSRIPLVTDLKWSGTFKASVQHNVTAAPTTQLNAPKAEDVLAGLAQGFFALKSQGSPLTRIDGKLGEVPYVGSKLQDVLRKGAPLNWLTQASPSLAGLTFNQMVKTLQDALPGLVVQFQPSSLINLINGEPVSFLHFDKAASFSGDKTFFEGNPSIDLFDVVEVALGASLGGSYTFSYRAGMGIDTGGFYIDDYTGFDGSATLWGDLKGTLRVVGLSVLGASGGLSGTLSANSHIVDRVNPSDHKVYLGDISSVGASIADQFTGTGNVKVDYSVGVKVLFFGKTWRGNWFNRSFAF